MRLSAIGESVRMFHGGKRMYGPTGILPPRKGRYEAGPGIYLTTSWETAKKYGKGGGKSVWVVDVADDLKMAHRVKVPVERVVDFLGGLRGLRRRDRLVADIVSAGERLGGLVDCQTVINLFVNYEAGSGRVGVDLAEWLVGVGVDAAYHNANSVEDWLVIINPRKIGKMEKWVDGQPFEMPLVRDKFGGF